MDRLLREHGAELLQVARRHSLCADDAQDAYQRALEIYVRRYASVDPRTATRWLATVTKHEALAVRRARLRTLGVGPLDADALPATAPTPDEQLATGERRRRTSEALRGCKRQEAAALILQAQGLSYREIADRMGWTYTKVNRCLTEGRQHARELVGAMDAGSHCRRYARRLRALAAAGASERGATIAGGEERRATAGAEAGGARLGAAARDSDAAARAHVRDCARCRAELRRLRERPRRPRTRPGPAPRRA